MKDNLLVRAFPALRHTNFPNLLTTVTVVLNVIIIYMAFKGSTFWAFWIYSIVIGIDVFDGKIAKLLKCTSEFGARLDSLCDAVSFCIMPAVIAIFMGFNNPAAIILMILNACAGMWRLAYFDIEGLSKSGNKEYYVGTPTTRTAAIFFIGIVVFGFFRNYINIFFYVFFIISPILMLANIKVGKVDVFAKLLYVFVPITMILYFFAWGN